MIKSLKALVAELLADSWQELGFRGQLASIEVKPSERPEFGDFSSNIALVGATRAKMAPRELAEHLVPRLPEGTFSRVEIAGPGFINLFLLPETIQSQLREILKGGDQFGRVVQPTPTEIQIEFVSSNPTGPLTVGHGRQAVLGDVLASLYEALGYRVTREYYFNDEGRQIELLTDSTAERVLEIGLGIEPDIPENGYEGEYLKEIASGTIDANQQVARAIEEMRKEKPQGLSRTRLYEHVDPTVLRREATERIIRSIKEDLAELGVVFDTWFSERTLHERGEVAAALQAMKKQDGVYEKDGAIWLKAEENGGVKDSVLIRSDGQPTYLMVDIAYHIDKRRRNFQHVINVQGADHQVEQSSMKAAMRILGYPEDFLDYALHQFVSIKEGKSAARMSTRAGRFIPLSDLVQELGRDVVRYFMVARKPESHLEFDLDLARAESMDNPVYYIQYAHTRIASIFRKAGVSAVDSTEVDLSPLRAKEELDLIKRLDRFPEVVEEAALGFAPHLLADYALNLARVFHPYYTDYRVIGKDAKVMLARLALLRGVQTVFRNCLQILGMSVPEAM